VGQASGLVVHTPPLINGNHIGEYAMNNLINSPVSITAIGFGRDMQPIPKRMEWGGRTYQSIDRGIRVISRRGEQIHSTVTMSDGERSFCLRENAGAWMLLSVC
jgi:hypothetical protein